METFVIRLWVPDLGEPDPAGAGAGLHGVVVHSASGAETRFASDAELLTLLRQHAPRPA